MGNLTELYDLVSRGVRALEEIGRAGFALAEAMRGRPKEDLSDEDLVGWTHAAKILGIQAQTPAGLYRRIVDKVEEPGQVPKPDVPGQGRGTHLWYVATLRRAARASASAAASASAGCRSSQPARQRSSSMRKISAR